MEIDGLIKIYVAGLHKRVMAVFYFFLCSPGT